jgi:hypothetical protein
MISCQSARIEYKYIVPDVDFPKFPILDREVHADGSWTLPKDSVDLLAEYYVRIMETEKDYKDIKRLLEKGKEQ